jgi:large repetitive protein
MMIRPFSVMLVACLPFVLGCQAPPRAVAPVSPQGPSALAIQPPHATLTTGQGLVFQAGAQDGSRPAVTWEATGGTIDPSGRFTAPDTPGSCEVRAKAWGGRVATARVDVVPVPRGPIQAPDRILPGAKEIQASVPDQPGSAFQWSIQGGTFLGDARERQVRFSVASTAKVLTLGCRITNAAGLGRNVSLEIPLAAPVRVKISAASTVMTAGRERTFGFDLKGGLSGRVAWSVLEPGGGTVDARGRYHAPMVPGTYTLQVKSLEDPSARATLPVRVVAAPFGRIQGPGRFAPGAKGLKASVEAQEGCSYFWTLGGGALTSAKGAAITFDAGDGPSVDIACVITNEAGETLRLSLAARASR